MFLCVVISCGFVVFLQALSDERRAAVGVEWGWRVGSSCPTFPLDGIVEELDRLFDVFRSFKWDLRVRCSVIRWGSRSQLVCRLVRWGGFTGGSG
jgi:hypothetical protein